MPDTKRTGALGILSAFPNVDLTLLYRYANKKEKE